MSALVFQYFGLEEKLNRGRTFSVVPARASVSPSIVNRLEASKQMPSANDSYCILEIDNKTSEEKKNLIQKCYFVKQM